MFTLDELLKATGGKLIRGKKDISIKGLSIDSRTIKAQEAFIAIKGDNFDGHDFIPEAIKKGASCIIRASASKFPPLGRYILIEVKDTLLALGDIARFKRRKFNLPVIAVTGSNGKTTTKEMIAEVLAARYRVLKNPGTKNNQIGLPMALLNLDAGYDMAVLEVGTNHFGEVDYLSKICLPNIGVITNIGKSHLEYLHDLKGVLREKRALLNNLKIPAIAILNADDKLLSKEACSKKKEPLALTFGIRQRSDFFASDIKLKSGRTEFLLKKKHRFTLKTSGTHNVYNALIAIAVGRIFGLSYAKIANRLSVFTFPEGRFNLKAVKGIRFIDDTYNSNPSSLEQALMAFDSLKIKGRKIFVMGDMFELGRGREAFHRRAAKTIAWACDIFVATGKLSQITAEALVSGGFAAENIFTCATAREARDILFKRISPRKNDIILVKGSRLMKMEGVLKT
jgi:UDP-N-acetylmuramoyl-tripeptide--D-alanyl-D-alanine ligase